MHKGQAALDIKIEHISTVTFVLSLFFEKFAKSKILLVGYLDRSHRSLVNFVRQKKPN